MEIKYNDNKLKTSTISEKEEYIKRITVLSVIMLIAFYFVIKFGMDYLNILIKKAETNNNLLSSIAISVICFIFFLIAVIFYVKKIKIIENEEFLKRKTELEEIAKMELYNNNENYKKYINEIKGKNI